MKLFKILVCILAVITCIALFYVETDPPHTGMHSSKLEQVTSEDGDTQRIDYMLDGVITYATDRHYATVIKKKTGNTVLEQYYDEEGNPEKQTSGHYALLREYDDSSRNFKVTYLGADLEPMLNTSGYSTWVRTYNEQGKVETERYFDAEGEPTENSSGYHGRLYQYENNRNTEILYFDTDGRPVVINSGYAIFRRSFYESGKVENEFYYDEKDQPVALPNGEYGLHREYDEQGRNNVFTFLGADGEPVMTRAGYATLIRTFYPDNTAKTDMYYDEQGEPVALAKGHYGILREEGRTTLLKSNGERYFNLNQFLYDNTVSVPVLGLIVVLISAAAGKKGNLALLGLYLVFIVYMTLLERTIGDMRANLELFWSYRLFLSSPSTRVEILNNIWLFIPLGAILYNITRKPWSLIFPFLMSAGVETVQYFTGVGLAEYDDIVSNGLGGIIGYLFASGLRSLTGKRARCSDREEDGDGVN